MVDIHERTIAEALVCFFQKKTLNSQQIFLDCRVHIIISQLYSGSTPDFSLRDVRTESYRGQFVLIRTDTAIQPWYKFNGNNKMRHAQKTAVVSFRTEC